MLGILLFYFCAYDQVLSIGRPNRVDQEVATQEALQMEKGWHRRHMGVTQVKEITDEMLVWEFSLETNSKNIVTKKHMQPFLLY